ncbi:MAG: carboxypeptidase regulatory-like domain-containing protein [Acidimicrobiia bacterium]|nr:carboxypeptidase regulatory-like domain-containing protein [Acidimicrobiia bacterium]
MTSSGTVEHRRRSAGDVVASRSDARRRRWQRRRDRQVRFRRALLVLLVGCAALTPVGLARWGDGPGALGAGSVLDGVVFADRDYDGERDAPGPGEPAWDPLAPIDEGVAGVTVSAFGPSGEPVGSATTGSDGRYELVLEADGPYRLEFGGFPDGFEEGPRRAGGGAAVRFVDATTADGESQDLALVRPKDHCGADPLLVVSCFTFGASDGAFASSASLYSLSHRGGLRNVGVEGEEHGGPFPANGNGDGRGSGLATRTPAPGALAQARDVGAVWGLAYDPGAGDLYAAAYTRQAAGYGPAGPGAIYRVPIDTDGTVRGAPETWVDLASAAYFGAGWAGGGSRAGDGSGGDLEAWADDPAVEEVSRSAFGDIEIGPDDSTLYAVALRSRELIALPLGVDAPDPEDLRIEAIPGPCRAATDVRPFALARSGSELLVGGVCSAETAGSPGDLAAWVLAFDPTAAPSRMWREVVRVGLGPLTHGADGQSWSPWRPGARYSSPLLSGIAVDGDDLILALRDRGGDQTSGASEPQGVVQGDLLRLCWEADRYQLEANGSCGEVEATIGTGNGQGPLGGEFYVDDLRINVAAPQTPAGHSELVQGAVAQLPGHPTLAATFVDPTSSLETGVAWLSSRTGAKTRAYVLVETDPPAVTGALGPRSWGKTNSLGDLEVLCDRAPLIIGDRIWHDDGDGIQEPGERGLEGVRVELWTDGVRVGSTVTDGEGYWWFGGVGDTHLGGGARLGADVGYEVVVPGASGADRQPALDGLRLTLADAGDADSLDSDATLDAIGGARVAVRTAGAGATRFDLDVGFARDDLVALGDRVFWDVDNDGRRGDGEEGIVDACVRLFGVGPDGEATGAALAETRSGSDGGYRFDALEPGSYVVEVSCLPPGVVSSTGGPSGAPQPYEGEATPDPDAVPVNDDDNGRTVSAPDEPVTVRSRPVTLRPGEEPTGERPAGGSPVRDDSADDTVDFGFLEPLALGGVVWSDSNGDAARTPTETTLSNIAVELVSVGPDGVAGTSDDSVIARTRTVEDGAYRFDGLGAGDYVVVVDAPDGLRSSADVASTADPDSDIAGDDNGLGDGRGPVSSGALTLAAGTEPDDDGDSSRWTNLTVDFGLLAPRPELRLRKLTAGFEAREPTGTTGPSGPDDVVHNPVLGVGSPVRWTYEVTNTGNVTLDDIGVSDDTEPSVVCPGGELAPGATVTCAADGVVSEGQYANRASAHAIDRGGPGSPEVSSQSVVSHLYGVASSLTLRTYAEAVDDLGDSPVPGGPDPSLNRIVAAGSAVEWLYVLTNHSSETLRDVTAVSASGELVACPATVLAPGEQMICRRTQALVPAGQIAETATASATDSRLGVSRTAPDPAHVFAAAPAITLLKTTNGIDIDAGRWPSVVAGDVVRWVYTIRNTGNVALDVRSLVDDVEGPIDCSGAAAAGTPLEPGASRRCERTSTARPGTYANTATVLAEPVGLVGASVSAEGRSGYVASDAPVETGALAGSVWRDEDGDGRRDASEVPIGGVRVTIVVGDRPVASTVTDAEGVYRVDGLEPGDYEVVVDRSSIPADLELTTPGIDSDVDQGSSRSGTVQVEGGKVNPGADIGARPRPATLSIRKSAIAPAAAGATLTWEIVVRNEGPTEAGPPIEVVDSLAVELSVARLEAPGWSCIVAGRTVRCAWPERVPAGAGPPPIRIHTRVAPTARGVIPNRASVSQGSGPGATADASIAIGVVLDAPLAGSPGAVGPDAGPVPTTVLAEDGRAAAGSRPDERAPLVTTGVDGLRLRWLLAAAVGLVLAGSALVGIGRRRSGGFASIRGSARAFEAGDRPG